MSEGDAASNAGASGADGPEDTKKKSSKKMLAILAGALVLLGGGAGAAWKMHLLPFLGDKASSEANHARGDSGGNLPRIVLPIPAATANLDNGDGRTVYVKMTASVEAEGIKNDTALKEKMPEIQDIFQTYLHESRPQDLHGSGFYRLREALLRRLRVALAPLTVSNLYITELLTQ